MRIKGSISFKNNFIVFPNFTVVHLSVLLVLRELPGGQCSTSWQRIKHSEKFH